MRKSLEGIGSAKEMVLFCFVLFAILNMEVRGGITENVIFELILEEGK